MLEVTTEIFLLSFVEKMEKIDHRVEENVLNMDEIKKTNRREKIIAEILHTEQTYQRHLELIAKVSNINLIILERFVSTT